MKPLDEQTILKSIEKTKKVVTIEDGICEGGLATVTLECIQKHDLHNIKIKNFGYPDKFIKHGKVEEIEKIYGLDKETIKKRLDKAEKKYGAKIINTDFVIVISKFIDDPSHVFALQIKQIQSILCRYFFNFFCLETR